MYLTNLKNVRRILPEYLAPVADEADQVYLLKAWLLDDELPDPARALTPTQTFFRSAKWREWLDTFTKDYLTVFVLDVEIETTLAREPEDWSESRNTVDVLLGQSMEPVRYVEAVRILAERLGVPLSVLPALILFVSSLSKRVYIVSLKSAGNEHEVKDILSGIIDSVAAAHSAWLRSNPDDFNLSGLKPHAAEEILELIVKNSGRANSAKRGRTWVIAEHVETVLSIIANALAIGGGGHEIPSRSAK